MLKNESDLAKGIKKVLFLDEKATDAEIFVEIGRLQERAGRMEPVSILGHSFTGDAFGVLGNPGTESKSAVNR